MSIQRAIAESIAACAWDNGMFLAERLHAAEQSEASLLLVAQCLHGRGNVQAALMLLQASPCTAPDNRYLKALCCVALHKHREAEQALVRDSQSPLWQADVPRGAYGLTLLGTVYRALQQRDRAVQCFQAALAQEPLMWTAAEGLCALGVEEHPMETAARSAPLAQAKAFPASPFGSPAFATPQGPRRFALDTPHTGAGGAGEATATAAMTSGAVDWTGVVHTLGHVRWLRGRNQPAAALVALKSVDEAQRKSAWSRVESGRAFAEMADYGAAAREFDAVRRSAPWRVEGMEVYSTVLWHQKREAELALLARGLVAIDKEAPESWVAVGNCFSLLKEHDAALRFFQRAIQVAPSFAYAYTLCGHEYVATDDMDQAASFFRSALLHDARHYNAWYGLGMIYFRTQRLQLADFHFSQALALNPANSALHTYRGMVASKQRDWDSALESLDRALACNPKNVLARSQKAQVLIHQGQVEEGLAMVEHMLEASPREAFLHFLKASASAKRGDKETALTHYTIAMDLDSKNGPLIKTRIERIFNNPLLGGQDPATAVAGAAAPGGAGAGVVPMDVSMAEEEFEV